jgi:ATP/maltotriose-dependent transcriptional regulator MalT
VPLCSDPASAAGPLHGADLLDPSKIASSANLLNTASLSNPSKTPGQETCGAHLHQNSGKRHQQAARPICVDSDPRIAVSVNRLHPKPNSLESARRTLLDSVKRRQRLGNSRAALYEPDTLLRNLHRCLLDPSKLEALVRREGLVEVRTNPDGAADGSFQASQREMTGGRTGQLSGSDREVLEVLVTGACCQGQKVSAGLERLLPSNCSGMKAGGR